MPEAQSPTGSIVLFNEILHWAIVALGWTFALGILVGLWALTPWFPW